MDYQTFIPLSYLIIFLLPLFIIIRKTKSLLSISRTQVHDLPPGPQPWPIIGDMLHLGSQPHISLSHLSRIHGPLISLKLGSRLLIVASSPAAATEILKTNDRLLCGRNLPKVALPELQNHSLVWAAATSESWKSLRSLCRNELLSTKAIESQSFLRDKKVAEMVEFMELKEGKVLDVGEIVFSTVFNTLGNLCFSKDFIDLNEIDRKDMADHGLKGIMGRIMELGATPNISDFYPVLERFDLQGLRKKFMKLVKDLFAVWEILIKERRESAKGLDHSSSGDSKQDFLDVMIASGFSDIQIHVLALELFSAGTDTSTSTIEWTMSELIKNKEAMNKVCEELKRELGPTNAIKESQIPSLPYLHACVKETLRLHPPVPFLIPHYSLETCRVMGYTIPRNSQVIVNLWALGRDPMSWEDPLLFKPERFLETNLDFKGQDFEFLPFGAGRRMCPGLPLATKQVHFILAVLLHKFDWFLPDGEDPCQLDMTENFGITLRKERPLLLIPKKRIYSV